jgi:hypothetical protein
VQKYTTELDYQRSLSTTNAAIVNEICNNRLTGKPIDLASSNLDPILKNYPYTLNSTPVVLSRKNTEILANTTAEMPAIIRKMIKIVFNDNAEKIAQFYGVDSHYLTDALALDILPHIICRSDIIHGQAGYKILELNVSGNLGGWQPQLFESLYRNNSALKPFIGSTDTIKSTNILQHYINSLVDSSKTDGEPVALLVVIDDPVWHDRVVNLYQTILARLAHNDHITFIFTSTHENITFSDHKMFVDGQKVHALLRQGESDLSTQIQQQLIDCFVHGNLVLPDNPVSALLSDKRSLALLYNIKDDPTFTQNERELIHQYIPWTVTSGVEQLTFEGKKTTLSNLMTTHKDTLVVKQATDSQGNSVYIGRNIRDKQWQALSEKLSTDNSYVIQQFYHSSKLLAENGHREYTLFDAIWGVFSFTGSYGGISLRIMPQGNLGIINAAQGAQIALVFEQRD